jgi:hypothetical protein
MHTHIFYVSSLLSYSLLFLYYNYRKKNAQMIRNLVKFLKAGNDAFFIGGILVV